MASVLTETSTFTATVTVPDDGDPLDAASVVPLAFQALTNRTRKLVDRCTGVAGTGEFVYDSPKVRTRIIPASMLLPSSSQIANVPGWYFQLGRQLSTTVNFPRLIVPIGAWLPDGATFRRIRALVAPGIARATVGDRMQLVVTRVTSINFGDPIGSPPVYTDIVTQADDGTVNRQVISSGFVTESIDKAAGGLQIQAYVQGGVDSGTNRDDVEAVEIQFEDPGPFSF